MSRPNPFVLIAVLLLFVAIFGGVPLLKGGLFLDANEGDSFHLLDILLQINMGSRPHLDFSTPLGFLAFLPISVFVEAGYPTGTAILLAQLGVAIVLFPFVIYVGLTRFSRSLAWMFGVLTLGLVLSLSFGGGSTGVSVAMHYNRWAWALAFVAVALAILPSRREHPIIDSVLIGIFGVVLALLKATYFVALAPGVFLALYLRWRGLGVLAAFSGAIAAALVTIAFQGFEIWSAYMRDLVLVLGSEVRPFAGANLATIIAGSAYFGVTLLGGSTFFMVRRSGHDVTAYALLLLVPGFIYVTYQNFGNDPQWIWFLGLVLFTLRPESGFGQIAGQDLRLMMGGAAWIALALNFPSLFANATSPISHARMEPSRFQPMIPQTYGNQDIFVRNDRGNAMTALVHLDREDPNWARFQTIADRGPLSEFEGITFPYCEWASGSRAYLERVAEELVRDGVTQDAQVLFADSLAGLWLFGPFKPLKGGAPWYYGGLTGLENADYLVIPKCSFVAGLRGIMIEELKSSDYTFSLNRDSELYALFAVEP